MTQLSLNQDETQSFRLERISGVYLKEEEKIQPFMNLERFVMMFPNCPFSLILQLFQNVLRDLLGSFCGGWLLNTKFRLSFPAFYWNSKIDMTKMKRLYPFLIKLREYPNIQKLSLVHRIKKMEGLLEKSEFTIDEAAFVISECYKILSELISESGQTKNCESVEVEPLGDVHEVYKDLNRDKLKILKAWEKNCKEILSGFVSGVYVHGSMATFDYTDFSDMDIVLIPKIETIEDPNLLKKFAYNCILSSCFLYRFNYLQHGSYLIISPFDLRYYNAAILPPEVFKYSKVIYGKRELNFAGRDSKLDYLVYTWKMVQNIRYCAHNGFQIKNMWQLCVFISFILILPVLYLQILNDYVYKTYSFNRARRYFSADEWEGVDTALEIRGLWKYKPTLQENLLAHLLLDLKKNPILFEYIMKKYSKGISSSFQERLFEKGFYKKALLFSETIAQRTYDLAVEGLTDSYGSLQCSSIA